MKNKNVVMFVYNFFENDSRVLKEATSIVNNGFKVTLYALWKEGLKKNETINGFNLIRIERKPLHQLIFSKSGLKKLKKLIYGEKKSKSKTKQVNKPTPSSQLKERPKMSALKFFVSTLNKFFSYKSFYSEVISDIKKSNQPIDFIHCHDMNTLQLGYKLKKKFGKQLIYDSHELFIERDKPYFTPNWYKNLQKKFEKKRIKKADGVITVSNSIADEFVSRYGIKYPVLIYNTPYFVESSQSISIREKLSLSENKKIIMYSGGFTMGRGLEKLVESIQYMPSDFHLVLLGFGKSSFVSMLNNIAETNNLQNQFSIYGPVPSKQVPLYLSSADLCISPIQNVALNNYYSCPNKVFEYIQARVPMALSNFPELQRIIDEEKIGVTFDPSNSKNIAESVVGFIQDEKNYKQSKENLDKSAKKYNWENEEKKLIDLYQQITK